VLNCSGSKKGFLFLILACLLLILASPAFARAGGGGSYGGSSGGGGSYGGSSSSGSYGSSGGGSGNVSVGFTIFFIIVMFFIVSAIMAKGNIESRKIFNARKIRRKQAQEEMREALDELTRRDPGFTQKIFLRNVNAAFVALQEAWSNQDLFSVRSFISDGVDERFCLQIEMQKAEGYRNRMENITVKHSEIAGIYSDSHFDTIHVRITAKADDSDVDLKTGKRIRRNSSEPFTEYWSFLRKPGVQTLEGKSLGSGICPNCSASIILSDTGSCENCDSLISSGEYDWVLAEITQEIEWNLVSPNSSIPGFKAMITLDPGFNLQHIEDRASVIFWRLMRSWFSNNRSFARKTTLPSFLTRFEKNLSSSRNDEGWLFFRDAAVGTVEVREIIMGTEDQMDRIEVLIKWSGIDARRNENGEVRVTGRRTIRPRILVLARRHGVRTRIEQCMRSYHCPGCGAPCGDGDTGDCEYCGIPEEEPAFIIP